MKRIICLFIIILIALPELAIGEEQTRFSVLNGVQFDDSVETVLEKEPFSQYKKYQTQNEYNEEKNYIYMVTQMGLEELNIWMYFTDKKLSEIEYRITNNTLEHIQYLYYPDDEHIYTGADSESEFDTLFEQMKQTMVKKYGEPDELLQKPLRQMPSIAYTHASENEINKYCAWIYADAEYCIKIELVLATFRSSKKGDHYFGEIRVGL